MKKIVLLSVVVLLSILSCKKNNKEPYKEIVDFEKAHTYYLNNLNSAISYLDSLSTTYEDQTKSKYYFVKARESFKKAEPFASYLNPEVGHRANGPALPIHKEDSGIIVSPFGLQKIEENIYDTQVSLQEFKKDISLTKGLMLNLKNYIEEKELTPQRFFVATHQQLLRIISFSITGFDTPVSLIGINEAKISLGSLKEVYELSIKNKVENKNPKLHKNFEVEILKAIKFIDNSKNFESFDRYSFIRNHMNPITRHWVEIRKYSELWDGRHINSPFNFDAPTFFENDSFNPSFFMPVTQKNTSPELIDLGEKLFYEPKLSSNGKMSCVSCHMPESGYDDNLPLGIDKEGRELMRNTPTLINVVYQKGFFWDGRSPTLTDQIASVFTNINEFDTAVHTISNNILADSTYSDDFKTAFGKTPNSNKALIKALSAYVSTLNSFNSKFDKNIRGELSNYTEEEKLGMNLYSGKALCATCHFIPLTNGTVPPFFAESEKEVIGVPKTAKNQKLDDDKGFYWVFEEPLHKNMFKTPTVRNAELTAPYMHNGVYSTLEEVIDFYNKGGGQGLGFDLPNQTLPPDNLNLTEKEIKALIAFMKTLSDNPFYE